MTRVRVVLLASVLATTACGPAGEDVGDAADGAAGPDPSTSGCADAPLQTWETFGRGFLRAHCQGCHASGVDDRRGAPADVVFDAHDDAVRSSTRILARAGGDAPTMPPAGGVPEDDRERLRLWIECFETR